MSEKLNINRAKGLLKEQCKTQDMLAGYAGVSREWVSKILTGKKSPTDELIAKIADFLGVEVSEIIEGGEAGPLQELMEIFKTLDKAGQYRLLALAHDLAAGKTGSVAEDFKTRLARSRESRKAHG